MSTSKPSIDPVRLGLVWRRLDGIADQVAETFVRAAFSVVVRDNYDMAFSLFDGRGRQLTQSKRSIPSFMGTLPHTLSEVLRKIPPERLNPGDVVITNDPWVGTGHLNDISMAGRSAMAPETFNPRSPIATWSSDISGPTPSSGAACGWTRRPPRPPSPTSREAAGDQCRRGGLGRA